MDNENAAGQDTADQGVAKLSDNELEDVSGGTSGFSAPRCSNCNRRYPREYCRVLYPGIPDGICPTCYWKMQLKSEAQA